MECGKKRHLITKSRQNNYTHYIKTKLMKTLKLIALGLAVLGGTLARGQSDVGSIKGYIYDGDNGDPLFFATAKITHVGNTQGSTSDEKGKFLIGSIQPGTYLLEVSYMGKATARKSITVKSGQVAYRDTVFLYDTAGMLTTYTKVEYVNPLIDPYEVSKPTLQAEQLGKMAELRNPANLLKVIGEGAFTINEGTQEVYFRGSRSNGISTYLDGLKIQGAMPSVPAVSIKSYAVFTGGLPAKYGDTSGGVIEIETKSYFDLYNQKMAELGTTYP